MISQHSLSKELLLMCRLNLNKCLQEVFYHFWYQTSFFFFFKWSNWRFYSRCTWMFPGKCVTHLYTHLLWKLASIWPGKTTCYQPTTCNPMTFWCTCWRQVPLDCGGCEMSVVDSIYWIKVHSEDEIMYAIAYINIL